MIHPRALNDPPTQRKRSIVLLQRRTALASLALLVSLGAAACGDDSSDTATVSTGASTATPTTTAAPSTTTTAAAGTIAPGSPEAAVAAAYSTVFDSNLDYDAKAAHLEDAAALEDTVAKYTAGGKSFGGFKLTPTAVTITGNNAAVVYDVYFGTAKQYADLKGAATLVNGTWTVGRAEFCGFMASARTPCPA